MKSNPLIGPVTIPRRAHSGMAVLPWAQDVNRALQQLRDRRAMVGGASGRSQAGTSFNVFARYYVYDFTVDFELATFAMTQNLISPSVILFYVRNGIAYENPTPEEIPLDDRDNDGTIEAGLIYPRIYIYQPDPAAYHGGANIVQPIPPPEGEPASMDLSDPDNSFIQPLL